MKIQLLSFPGCPNAAAARRNLTEALRRAGLPRRWEDVILTDPSTPQDLRAWPSPTILVDGRDCAGAGQPAEGSAGRLYPGTGNAPSVETILRALPRTTARERQHGFGTTSLGVLSSLGAAALPVGGCTACWPVYGAVLASLGLPFVSVSPPVTAGLLAVSVAALAWQARGRRRFEAVAAGAVGGVLVFLGALGSVPTTATILGLALLLGASITEAWLARRRRIPCPARPAPADPCGAAGDPSVSGPGASKGSPDAKGDCCS